MECRLVFLVLVERTFAQFQRINKRPQMELPACILQMQPHGRQVRVAAILLAGIVGCKETCADHDSMQHAESGEPFRQGTPRGHLALLSVRIRGSARYRSKSAPRFPSTKKIVENRIAPTTTYKSRERIDSNNSGPSPGQLITTSTISELLSNAPMLKPNSEIRGLAAAGSA